MDLTDIEAYTGAGQPATQQDVRDLQTFVKSPLPPGYAEFVTTFGAGLLDHHFRVYMPQRIRAELDAEFRPRWKKYFLWDEPGTAVQKKDLAKKGIIIADTREGDEIVFLAGEPTRLIVLPRRAYRAEAVGSHLWEAVEWFYEARYVERPRHHVFLPHDSGVIFLVSPGAAQAFATAHRIIHAAIPDAVIEADSGPAPESVDDAWFHLYSKELSLECMLFVDAGSAHARFHTKIAMPPPRELLSSLEARGFSIDRERTTVDM